VTVVERLEHPDGVARSYPAATVHNGVVYPCGQVPVDADGATPPGLADQVRSNLDATLRRAGADLSSILQITVYLDGPDGFAEYDATYRAAFHGAPLPPRTTLFVAGFRGTKHIELTAVAAVTATAGTGSAPTPN
jgi:2-iminobutanoate/2-iminopropanoate deaminase